jgi:hypothetical protein
MTYTVDGKVIGTSRDVKTKFGLRSVVDVLTSEGRKAVWKAAGDMSIGRLCDGERVTLTLDEKGAVQEIEGSFDRSQAQRIAQPISPAIEPNTIPNRPMGFTVGLPMEAERTLQRQIGAIQKPVGLPVVDSIPSVSVAIEPSIDAELDKYSSIFRSCLARAEMLSPSNSEALALEMFKGLANKLAA